MPLPALHRVRVSTGKAPIDMRGSEREAILSGVFLPFSIQAPPHLFQRPKLMEFGVLGPPPACTQMAGAGGR